MKKTTFLLLLLTVAFFLNGCIYIKLFKLKGQLEHFDQNFELDPKDGLKIKFLHPVFSEKDIKELKVAVAIEEKTTLGNNWQIIFQKELKDNQPCKNEFSIKFTLNFMDKNLVGLDISESYFSFIPKEIIVAFLKSFSETKIKVNEKSIESNSELSGEDLAVPTKEEILKTLGEPFETKSENENYELIYKYRFIESDSVTGKKVELPDFYQISFQFNNKNNNLILNGKIPMIGEIKYTLSKKGKGDIIKKSKQESKVKKK